MIGYIRKKYINILLILVKGDHRSNTSPRFSHLTTFVLWVSEHTAEGGFQSTGHGTGHARTNLEINKQFLPIYFPPAGPW